jgi:hypothetical protein
MVIKQLGVPVMIDLNILALIVGLIAQLFVMIGFLIRLERRLMTIEFKLAHQTKRLNSLGAEARNLD